MYTTFLLGVLFGIAIAVTDSMLGLELAYHREVIATIACFGILGLYFIIGFDQLKTTKNVTLQRFIRSRFRYVMVLLFWGIALPIFWVLESVRESISKFNID